jgi:hypothetical protein
MHGRNARLNAVCLYVFEQEPEADVLSFDARKSRAWHRRKHKKANGANARAEIENVRCRLALGECVPRRKEIIGRVAVALLPLKNAVRGRQAVDGDRFAKFVCEFDAACFELFGAQRFPAQEVSIHAAARP